MNPNPEVYGAPETWQTCKYFPWTGTSEPDINLTKPKIPNFDNGNGSLGAGNTAGKTILNIPIDKTLCPCGQDNTASCLGDISIFQNAQDVDGNKQPSIITPESNISNWFIYDGTAQQADFSNQGGENSRNYTAYKYQMWSPEGEEGTTHPNMNLKINPFLDWGTRSLLLQIKVQCITGYDSQNKPQTSWRYLKDWYDNYDQQPICGVSFIVHGRGSVTGSTITYRQTKGANNNFCGIGILDKIDNITDYYRFNRRAYTDSICEFRPFQYLRANYYSSSNITVVMFGIHRFDTMSIEAVVDTNTQSGWSVWAEVPCFEAHYNTILKWAACFGLPFTDKEKYTFNANYLDEDLYLPIIDDNGITHGEYTKGADNANNDYIDLDSIRDKNYNPDANKDPNTYSNTTGFNSIAAGASATIKYVLDSSNVRQLLTDLWTISHTIAGVDYENYDYKILDSFLVSNPIDSIVSIKRFPFEIPHTFSTQKTNVCLGKNTGSSQGYVTHNVFNTVIFSGVQIFPKFGNSFLDYAPYTEYELYIPFCGTVKLNAGDILDHTLNCRLQIDLTTGSCTAYILADDLVIETASGVVSCELQVAGTDSATVDSAIQNAVINHIGARTNKEIAMLSPLTFGGLLSAVSNPVKTSGAMENANNEISRADYNLTHIQTPVHSMGNAGGLTGWYQEFNARLIIYYPEGEAIDSSAPVSSTSPHLADLTAYAHNVGFACVLNGTVSEFHGKTVGNIDTSSIVGATEEERAQIKALFAQGVWLP